MTASHYETLEVRDDASLDAIKGAYKHLAQKWHPDKNFENRAFATKRTAELTEAYRTLSNPEFRAAHDQSLKTARQAREDTRADADPRSKAGPPPPERDHDQAPQAPRSGEHRSRSASPSAPSRHSTNQISSRKSIGDYIFGFIFIGFLLNLLVGAVLFGLSLIFFPSSSDQGGSVQGQMTGIGKALIWIWYIFISLLAAHLWKRDFDRGIVRSSANNADDNVGLKRPGYGPLAVGIGIVLLIGGKLAIAFQAMSRMNVTTILLILVLVSSYWVWEDAKKIGVKKGQLKGFADLSALGWLLASLFLWIVAFPTYLINRSELKRINGK